MQSVERSPGARYVRNKGTKAIAMRIVTRAGVAPAWSLRISVGLESSAGRYPDRRRLGDACMQFTAAVT
jgi:hypothetical protein